MDEREIELITTTPSRGKPRAVLPQKNKDPP
jgi:hypothetical protein